MEKDSIYFEKSKYFAIYEFVIIRNKYVINF